MSPVQSPAPAQMSCSPLWNVFSSSRDAVLTVGLLSGLVNILTLTSALFMLQVYDRVLASKSVPTLLALGAIALGAYAAQWLFELLRHRITGFLAEQLELEITPLVQRAAADPSRSGLAGSSDSLHLFRDLDCVKAFAHGHGPLALFDLPWIPVYVLIAFLLHPLIGWITIVGALGLLAVTVWTEWASAGPARKAAMAQAERNQAAETLLRGAEAMRAMGMERVLWDRWNRCQASLALEQRRLTHLVGGLTQLAKSLRFMLQSCVLAAGAYLVIQGQISGGSIVAATILAGRALAPIDLAIASWRPFVQARQAFHRLMAAARGYSRLIEPMRLPQPVHTFQLEGVDVAVPGRGRLAVRGVSMALRAGDALGVIGHSASGKSSLARAMVGLWKPSRGRVLFDGADIDHYPRERLGAAIGYLPQDVQLFDGTVAENIARFDPKATPDMVIAAAKAASCHDQILRLPSGYETQVGPGGTHLSAGQRQRLGLARALFGSPFLVVLDEPNANLDAEGEGAVALAITQVRERGGIVVVVAHRPSAIAATNLLLMLGHGEVLALGPRDEILAKSLKHMAKTMSAADRSSQAPQTSAKLAG